MKRERERERERASEREGEREREGGRKGCFLFLFDEGKYHFLLLIFPLCDKKFGDLFQLHSSKPESAFPFSIVPFFSRRGLGYGVRGEQELREKARARKKILAPSTKQSRQSEEVDRPFFPSLFRFSPLLRFASLSLLRFLPPSWQPCSRAARLPRWRRPPGEERAQVLSVHRRASSLPLVVESRPALLLLSAAPRSLLPRDTRKSTGNRSARFMDETLQLALARAQRKGRTKSCPSADDAKKTHQTKNRQFFARGRSPRDPILAPMVSLGGDVSARM